MTWSRERFGREVLGPITGEFCLRLWSLGSMLNQPEDAAMLFCARGGLRLMTAYQHFLSVTGLAPPTQIAPLMVSRVIAIKPAILKLVENGALPRSVASALSYEFFTHSLHDVVRAMSGCTIAAGTDTADKFTPERFEQYLLAPQGAEALAAIRQQSALFRKHLARVLEGRRHAILVDTGLFGTTLQLLQDGIPEVNFTSALITRSSYGGRRLDSKQRAKIMGLSVEIDSYSPFWRRSAILRYWHLIESTFEPDLASVRQFTEQDGVPVSNLEVPRWRDQLQPTPGSLFAGIMGYLDDLPHGDASAVLADTGRAWNQLHKAVVWPDVNHAAALDIGIRGNDFGMDSTSASARPWKGPLYALRRQALWREGDIARSRTPLRLLLLSTIEAAYGARLTARMIARAGTRAKRLWLPK